MAWPLSSWLMLVRAFQLVAALAAASMNGFLTAHIYTKKLGLSITMVVLELLICILLVYTTLAIIVQHTKGRAKRKAWLVCFIVCDVLFCAVDLAIIIILARAGLPSHCQGMSQQEGYVDEDTTHGQSSTVPFKDETGGYRGVLDKFCGYERSFFFVGLALVFTYIAAIVFTSLSLYETTHTPITKVNELLNSLERGGKDMELKPLESSPASSAPRLTLPPAPPSEGIITRSNSMRSTATSVAPSTVGGHRTRTVPRRIGGQPASLPSRRLSLPRTGCAASPGPGVGFVPIPLDEDSAEAALVADGMQHPQRNLQSHQRLALLPTDKSGAVTDADADASIGAGALVADGMQHQQRHHCAGSSSTAMGGMPMLLEEEQTADSALVSDGMRPSEPTLPPYEPGQSRMAGHGSENNELRLSEYVKGGTRAQDMKNSGNY